ncbi:MAG: hypothetical protein HOJ98_04930 [Microbacteriaceae bacterium]|jgi:hypothetical protein|nr:hypothetical protein [Microbacteriaceae bacterium]
MTALAYSTGRPVAPSRPRATSSTRQKTRADAVPKLRYIVVLLAGIFAILGGQLLLSIAVSGGAYEIASLKSDVRGSEQQLQIVGEEISALVAPDTLATLAGSMGMVPDNNPAYLRVSDGAVVGEAIPADGMSGTHVYAVTAGTETIVSPAIVEDVFLTIAQSQALEADAADVLATPQEEAAFATEATPVMTTVATTEAPAPRFGGSIPSPVTR